MRPRLAPHFTCAVEEGIVWLVAGEDVRYRLDPGGDPSWLRDAIARCDGSRTLASIIAEVPIPVRADAETALRRLYEERVLVDGTASEAHAPASPGCRVIGASRVAELVRAHTTDGPIELFVQDTLDHTALLAHNTAALAARRRWMWISTGAGSRAYVGPLFVPDAGPCAACVLVHFKRLSPAPDLYDALIAHGEHGGPFAAAELPPPALDVTASLARWKLSLAAQPVAAPALYALHVIEVGDLTVSSHAPVRDPECAACGA
ncbi:MAG: TOMM precursor leader peptide-binding protein [Polyangiales bacterium]